MQKIRLTKEFSFETGHALLNYDGLCKNLHGHSYKLFVTVIGSPNRDDKSPKFGMVVDFGDIKNIVDEYVINKYDHAIIMNANIGKQNIEALNNITERLIVTDNQPTCENMLIDIVEIIKNKLPNYISLHSIKLHETATSYAEWFQSDNQ